MARRLGGGLALAVVTSNGVQFAWDAPSGNIDSQRAGVQGLVVMLPARIAVNLDALHSLSQRHRVFFAIDGAVGTIVNPPPETRRPLSTSGFQFPLSFVAGLSVGYVAM